MLNKLLLSVALVSLAIGTAFAAGWIGSARLTGSYSCDNGETWTIVQPVAQSYSRPIDHTPYYTVNLTDDGQPWAFDAQRNLIRLSCSGYKVPAAPACDAIGGLCSTGSAICSVFTRWHGTTEWQHSGWVQTSVLNYNPNLGPRGMYTMTISSQVVWGSGNGVGINGCRSTTIPFTFGG